MIKACDVILGGAPKAGGVEVESLQRASIPSTVAPTPKKPPLERAHSNLRTDGGCRELTYSGRGSMFRRGAWISSIRSSIFELFWRSAEDTSMRLYKQAIHTTSQILI